MQLMDLSSHQGQSLLLPEVAASDTENTNWMLPMANATTISRRGARARQMKPSDTNEAGLALPPLELANVINA
jgi:hypothetical protein